MNISKENKKILNDEFGFVVSKMEKSTSPDEMMYYFTAFYNMINRIYNIEFSEELVFVNFVMENAYNAIMSRMGAVKTGHSAVVGFHENFGPVLIKITKDIRSDCRDLFLCHSRNTRLFYHGHYHVRNDYAS